MIVMTGDSITDGGRDYADPTSLGESYVSLVAAELPGQQVINTGISGNRAIDLQSRWDSDVLTHSPQVLTIMIGINDTWRRFDSNDPTSAEAFEASYADLVGRAQSAGVGAIIIVEPFVLPVRPEQWQWRADLDPKIAAARRVAEAFNTGYVATDGPLAQAARPAGAASLAGDGVHPTAAGHRLLADLILPSIRAALHAG